MKLATIYGVPISDRDALTYFSTNYTQQYKEPTNASAISFLRNFLIPNLASFNATGDLKGDDDIEPSEEGLLPASAVPFPEPVEGLKRFPSPRQQWCDS
eukprot:CAMPEP_0173463850 /NCGR_PEP_ID=MMETSP1357-20121228/68979_1 /TAXON_ID=77926 /ORGANISM="Hemiselmis rufescens, Strain PCC563" /LENGTH=98 /DNA_ID=CAMNT_0014431693 /DNA_START=46 /DNA_END=338 /DNA_ORIENTATION=-